jgi:hypothetical protein
LFADAITTPTTCGVVLVQARMCFLVVSERQLHNLSFSYVLKIDSVMVTSLHEHEKTRICIFCLIVPVNN